MYVFIKEVCLKIRLVCSEERESDIKVLLNSKGIEIDKNAEFVLFEKNYTDKKYIAGKKNETMSLIPFDEVVFFESFNNDTFCLTLNEKYSIKEKLYQLEEMLIFKDYIRINKSMLVNIHMISEIIPWIGSKFILEMKNGTKLDVNRTYYSDFKKKIGL